MINMTIVFKLLLQKESQDADMKRGVWTEVMTEEEEEEDK